VTKFKKYVKIERLLVIIVRKLNRKGFTLVELLVVLVILVVIMSIAIPSITSSMERSKQKQKNSKIELLESAAEIYVDRHRNTHNGSSTYVITIKSLICDNLLTKEQVKDPFNENYTLSGYVSYKKSGEVYSWVEMPNNNTYRLQINTSLTC